ncbi:hypothetical protein FRUB_08224 [Fimbriiglobus ruber]|uniref:Uncharacterized protein n=2 Tax=Fimbriiglobus ruber TaxID=1908690 RepID=A0A225D255_9BACT|nr:hypothetical protein FRUB_08224 [Fimbriiglobus ruber]
MQDAVSADVLSVGAGKKNQVALFSNPFRNGDEEALIVSESGRLTYLHRSDESPTGWKQEPVAAVPGNVTEVVSLVQTVARQIWAACVDAATNKIMLLKLDANNSWTDRSDLVAGQQGGWSQLYVHYSKQRPTRPVLFGLDPQTARLRQIHQSNVVANYQWGLGRTFSLPAKPDEFVAAYAEDGQQSGTTVVFGRCGEVITDWSFDSNNALVGTKEIATDAQSLAGAWDTLNNGLGVAYLATNRDFVLAGWPYTITEFFRARWAGLGFATATVWQDADERLHVYGVTDDKVFKVLHQTGTAPSGIGPNWPVWAQAVTEDGKKTPAAVELHANVAAVATDSYPTFRPTHLIKVDGARPSEAFRLYRQDVTTTWWSDEKIRLPSSGTPHVVSRYACEARLLNVYGAPVVDYEVVVSASSRVEMFANDVSYLIAPNKSAAMRTDAFGKVSFSIAADGLTPPVLYLNAINLAKGAVIRPAADVHAYLAGEGILPTHQRILDGPALENAKADGQPLVRDWKITPGDAVATFKNSFAVASGKPVTTRLVGGRAQPIKGFAVQTWDAGRPAYQEFFSDDEIRRDEALHRTHPAFGGIWDDILQWGADVWQGIKQGVIKVAKVVVDVAKKIASVVIYIGNKLVELGKFILGTLDAAARVVEAIFQQVGAAVSRVVDWLKSLFNFQDIWDTKKALEGVLKQAPELISTVRQKLGAISHGWFIEQEQAVRANFSDLKAQYAGGQLAMGIQKAGGGIPTASKVPIHAQSFANNPQANWMLGRVTANPPALHALSPKLRADTDGLWDQFAQIWEDAAPAKEFVRAAQSFARMFTELVDFNNPKPLDQREFDALFTFLESVTEMLLKTADAVVQSLLAIIQSATELLNEVLWTPLPPSPLTVLYKWIQSNPAHPPAEPEELTLGGLVCLTAAFPTTVFYKLIFGTDAVPFPGELCRPSRPRAGRSTRRSTRAEGPRASRRSWESCKASTAFWTLRQT